MDIRVNDNKRLRDAGEGRVVLLVDSGEELSRGEVLAEVQYLDHADQGWWLMLVAEDDGDVSVWAIPHCVREYQDHTNRVPTCRHHVDDIYLWYRFMPQPQDAQVIKNMAIEDYSVHNIPGADGSGTQGVRLLLTRADESVVELQIHSSPTNFILRTFYHDKLPEEYSPIPAPRATSLEVARSVLVARQHVTAMIDWVISANVTLAGTPVNRLLAFIQDPRIEILDMGYTGRYVYMEARVCGRVAKYETNDWSKLSDDAREMGFKLITQMRKETMKWRK